MRLITASLLLSLLPSLAAADDLDIYTNPTVTPLQAPLTALALDLNLTNASTVICSNVLTSTAQNCVDIRAKVTLGQLVTLLGVPVSTIGVLNPATLLADLSSSVRASLNAVISSASLTQGQTYVLGIQQILEALVNSRVAVVLNHNDKGPSNGLCAFADLASLPGLRQDTLACSNGAYLFAGLTNLADPLQLAALTSRILAALLPSNTAFSAAHPYQAKEIYAELAKYLRGDAIFNGHLGYFDYGDNVATTNLDATFPLLSWDASSATESSDHKRYQTGLAPYAQACSINLVHVQLTAAQLQDNSDVDLKTLFSGADANGNGQLALSEVVDAAATNGFTYGTADTRLINSSFVVQDNLFTAGDLSELDQIKNLGTNVSSYTGVIGLLGRGQSISGSLIKTLAVDSSLGSIAVASSRSSSNGITDAAYVSTFRPDANQKPAWVGNLKRLKLRAKVAPEKGFTVVDARDSSSAAAISAIANDGRIRNTALTIWTDATKLGTNVSSDGRKADLGGAGQRIPGYVFGGGGNPGRGTSGSARTLYYDSITSSSAQLALLNADDSGVRAELLAATGATSYTSPSTLCSSTCNSSFSSCGLVCTTNQTLCKSSCAATSTSCSALCVPGTLGNTCRTTCSNNLNSCNTSCDATATSCNSSCSSTQSSCLLGCGSGSDRSADTITRELLLHGRGFDVGTLSSPKGTGPASSPTNSGVTGRPWLMGAVLHSKPVAINYGPRTSSTDDVRVAFGSADGVLHMASDATGVENWGFMPQTVMGALATLRENQAGASLPYGVDGSPVVLIRDRAPTSGANAGRRGVIGDVTGSNGDRVLLFFGLRRGGAAYYALNVTDPDAPTLQWRISTQGLLRAGASSVVAGSAAQFASLGLSFSTPKVARLRRDVDGDPATSDIETRSVLIFGGGYNGGRNGAGNKIGKDLNNSRAVAPVLQVGQDDGVSSTDRGNAVFMVDAETGELLWRAVRGTTAAYTAASRSYAHPLLVDSIASDITVLDTDNDGFTDRLYVGDTGGRLWRGDFAGAQASGWTFGPIVSVGRHNASSNNVANDRRLFFAPDYVPLRGAAGTASDVVLFGTGDREDVLNLTTLNSFYAYKDPDTVSGKTAGEVISTEAALPQQANFTAVGSGLVNLNNLTTGYRLSLPRNGEKMFSAPVTLGGTVTFSSYVPPDPSNPATPICVPSEGASRLYAIGVKTTEQRGINNVSPLGRDQALPAGLPGEVTVLGSTTQSVGAQVYSIDAKETYRASWRERLGETQK